MLKQVDSMRQYQEDVENLNEVVHNWPRAQLVLGIQKENRHIQTLQLKRSAGVRKPCDQAGKHSQA